VPKKHAKKKNTQIWLGTGVVLENGRVNSGKNKLTKNGAQI